MNTRFCTTCKAEKEIIKANQEENKTEYLLSCGHKYKLIRQSLSVSMEGVTSLSYRKTGLPNVRHKQGNKPPNINFAKKFIEYGDIDYEAAVVLFNIQDRDYDFMNQAAFLCAQAVEKYLKGFLFWNSPQHYQALSGKKVLEKLRSLSHDLEKILNECVGIDKSFDNFRGQIKNIDKFSLLKYPDIEDELVYSNEGLTIGSDILVDVKAVGDFIKVLVNQSN